MKTWACLNKIIAYFNIFDIYTFTRWKSLNEFDCVGSSIDISGPGSNLDFNSPDSAEINTPVSGVEISHISRSIGRLHTPEKQVQFSQID